MALDNLSKKTITDFGGAWTDLDPPDVPPTKGLFARNVSYGDNVGTRYGFGQAFIPSAGTNAEFMTGMKNWIGPRGNLLVWLNTVNGKVRGCDLTAPTVSITFNDGNMGQGYFPSFANAGSRLYVSTHSSALVSSGHGYVISYQSGPPGSGYVADKIAPPPMTYAGSVSEPAAGGVTAGVHKWGYRVEHRGGFFGKLCPVNGSTEVFSPGSFTATGSKNARFTLNTTWPTDAIRVHIAMTTIENHARFIQTGFYVAVVGGSTSSVTVDVDLSDDQLAQIVNDWTFSQTLWTQTLAAAAPFSPISQFTHGNRMVYITKITDGIGNTNSAAVISENYAFQEFTQDQHIYYLPGRVEFVTGCSLSGNLFFFGPNGTHVTMDNGDVPITWRAADTVDTRRGTLAARGVELAPNGQYAWVASPDGLYLFNGAYPDLPISYYQSDQWRRINWAAAQTIQVKSGNTAVYVLVPLDGNTNPTHIFKFEWAAGIDPVELTPQQILFSTIETPGFFCGAIEMVQNVLPSLHANVYKRTELWMGPGDFGNLCNDESFDRPDWLNDSGSAWSVAVDGANARTGTGVAKRTADGTTSGFIQANHQIPAVSGQGFYVGAYAKDSSGNGFCGPALNFYQSDNSYVGQVAAVGAVPGGTYTLFSTTGTAPSGSAWLKPLLAGNNSAGIVYIDDIVVRQYAILREFASVDTNPYRDNGIPILSEYKTAMLPSRQGATGQTFKHQAQIYRAYGTGNLLPVVKGLDDATSALVRLLSLVTAPGLKERRGIDLKAEGASTLFTNNLCRDGGFEAAARWTVVSPFAITLDPASSHDGKHCLTHTSGAGSCSAADTFEASAGELFYVFCRAKNSSGADGRLILTLSFYTSAGAFIDSRYLVPGLSTVYRPWVFVGSAPTNTAYVQIVITAGNHTTGTHYIDDIAVIRQDGAWTVSSLTHYFSPHTSSR